MFSYRSLDTTRRTFFVLSKARSRFLWLPAPRFCPIFPVRLLSVAREARRKDYYGVLGITPKATQAQVKDAYLSQSLRWHPDRNKGNEEEAHVNFTIVSEAYSVLGNYERRRKYDKGMFREHGLHGARPSERDTRRADESARDFDQFFRSHSEGARKHKERMAKEKKVREERQQFGDAGTQQRFIFTTVFTLLAGFLYYVRRKRGFFM